MTNETTYFAKLPSTECADECIARIENFAQSREQLESRWARNYQYFYNNYYADSNADRGVKHGGEQEELSLMPVNHFQNIIQNWHVLITSIVPSFIPRAVNSDYKSLSQTKLAGDLIDYYNKESDVEQYTSTAVLHSLLFDAGYIKMEWNPNKGREYAVDDQENIYNEGDIEVSNPTAYDVIFDLYKKEFRENDWVIVRTYRSKWDLIENYVGSDTPDEELSEKQKTLKGEILSAPEADEIILSSRPFETEYVDSDDVEVFEFWHRKTPALPQGRLVRFTRNGAVLEDIPMPYRDIPIYQITAGQDIANQFGHSIANQLAPIQEAINSEYSTVLTNHEAFGVQNVVAPRDSNVKATQITGGLNFIEYNAVNAPGGGKPEPLNLTQTPPEVFNFIAMLEKSMEMVSGINSVIRGQPDSNLKSGTALALIQNQALQYASHLQKAYTILLEDIGTNIIRLLRDYATTNRMISIAGKHNRSAMKEFTGDDLVNIDRVIVDLGNPLAQTLAGRVELAQNLIQTGLLKTVEEYIMVVETGQLNSLTEHTFSELQNINAENEELMEQAVVTAIPTDDHRLHILEHKTLLDDPEARRNAPYVQNVLMHIQEHIQLMNNPGYMQLSQVLGNMSFAQQQTGGPAAPTGAGAPPPPETLTDMPQSIRPQATGGIDVQQPQPPRPPRAPGQ